MVMDDNKKGKLITKVEKLIDFQLSKFGMQKELNTSTSFRLFNAADCLAGNTIAYRRRDFYKVALLQGEYIIHYGDESIRTSGNSLSFFNPLVPYTIEEIKEEVNAGYFVFTEAYYDSFFKHSIKQFPLFTKESKPIFVISEDEKKYITTLLGKIEQQINSDYSLKDDLIRNHINELMHYAYTLAPASERSYTLSSKERMVVIFSELLDRQFPVDPHNQNLLRTPSDFAGTLNVHVNYLNRTLKEITGKSTSILIFERLLKESIILLKHTNANVSEIAYSLGFKDVSHFNHFFRKQLNTTPSSFRN